MVTKTLVLRKNDYNKFSIDTNVKIEISGE